MFSVEEYVYRTEALGSVARSVSKVGRLAGGGSVGEEEGVQPGQMPGVLPDELTAQYPRFANSLLTLLRTAEKTLIE